LNDEGRQNLLKNKFCAFIKL